MKKLLWEDAKKQFVKGKYFLMFTTTWCNDCKMMYPVVNELEEKAKNIFPDVQFIEVDGEEANFFREKEAPLEVKRVPSFYFIKDGSYHFIGYEYLPYEVLEQAIKNNL